MIAFGPIPSRRLGLSLGINNIVSYKVCSYSCVYCQIGNTHKKSIVRKEFYEPEKLIGDIEEHLTKLDRNHIPDYLTFVANGEPTLDNNLGREIKAAKKFSIPIAVITNASLIHHKHVRNDLMEADWVSVKVDTVDNKTWKEINRPHIKLKNNAILDGLKLFASDYKGKLVTETMIIKDYNDSPERIIKTASFIASLNPDTAFLSVPTRPPALKEIKSVAEEHLLKALQLFRNTGINTELLTGFEGMNIGITGNAFDDILNITAVHPLRHKTMEILLKKEKSDMSVVHSLISQGLIKEVEHEGLSYYIRNYNF